VKLQLHRLLLLPAATLSLALATPCAAQPNPGPSSVPAAVATVPGMPPVTDPRNLYSETAAGRMSPQVAGMLPRVYVPNV
jgi:hypothetical protein